MTKDMTTGTPWKLLLLFGLPLFVGNVFQQAYNLVDTMIVGKFVGPVALAGVGVASPVFNLINALLIGLSVGSSIMVSQLYGARRDKELPTAMTTILLISLIMALVLTVLGQLLAQPLLQVLGTPEEDLPYSVAYLRTIIMGLTFNVFYNQLSGLLRGLGNSRVPLYFLVLASVLNVVLDLLFVAVFRWGVPGAAGATILAQGISAALTWVYIRVRVPQFQRTKGSPLVSREMLRAMVRFGLPMALQQGSISMGHILLQWLINPFGTVVIGAFASASKIDLFTLMPTMSIGSAVSTFTAQNAGAGRMDRIGQGCRAANVMAISVSALLGGIVWMNRRWLIGMFLSSEEFPELAADMISAGAEILSILPCFYVVLVVVNMHQSVISGAGDTMFSMLTCVGMMGLRIVLAWCFIYLLGMDQRGIWWAFPASWAIIMVVVLIYYYGGWWKQKTGLERKKET